MAVTINCPHCGAASTYIAGGPETEVTCFRCGGKYRPSEARREEPAPTAPSGPPPIRGFGSGSRSDRPRRERRSRREADWDYGDPEERAWGAVRPVAIVLLVMWILGSLFALMAVGLALFSLVKGNELGPGARAERPAVVALAAVAAVIASAGLYGAVCMVRGTSRGWAIASAVLLFVGYIGCLAAWAISIWALVVLNRPDVRAAFDRARRRDF